MKDEGEPVTHDEAVLRLIWGQFFRDGATPKVSPRAFLPKQGEADGISVYREACLADPLDVLGAIAEEKRERYGVARLAVSELVAMGLAVLPAPVDSISGHAVVPELNIVAVDVDKEQCDRWQQALAAIAVGSMIRKPTR